MWRLGTLDDDIASRVIVQHLLKLGGDREKAIREWLDSRPKAKAPAPGPKQLTFVRRIDLGGFKPKVLGAVDKPVVMINANELAQTFPKALADQFARQVDFSKERLVLFTWGGPAADKFDYRVQDGEKVTEVIFDFTPSINGDFAIHAHLFAVSYEATMRIGPPRPLVVPQVRKIEEQPERVIWANKAFGPPVEITRAEDFDKAIPDAGWRLRNEAWKQQVLKKVDFKRERLVLFAWTGAGGESLDYRLLDRDIAPLVIFRNYVEHKGETKGHHFYLYAVAKDARLLLNSSGVVEQPAAKPPIREIDMRGLKLDKAQGDVTKPVKIANEEELVGTFLLFADKAWPGKILPQVDFKNEYVLLFTWGGSGGDQLTFRVNSIGTDDGREVEFRYMGGPDPDHRPHVRVFVLPRGATWKVTGVR
jgi:hypothetical protein